MDYKHQHLIIVNYAFEEYLETADDLLEKYFMLRTWANSCQKQGIKVSVFQRFSSNQKRLINAVDYHFLSDSLPQVPAYYHCAFSFNRYIQKYIKAINISYPDTEVCIHINGMIFPTSSIHLTAGINKSVRYVIQHHAEQPSGLFSRWLTRIADGSVDAYFFTTKWHAEPWIKSKCIISSKVFELMECTSICELKDKNSAKNELNLKADPLLLWTANLDKNKDPITILEGFEQFLNKYQNAKLIMLFQNTNLLDTVKAKIRNSELLTNSVKLIGRINYTEISSYYNAADIFVQGSSSEGSGIAVLDALACGAIPVITNIPSFVMLTQNSKVGHLWTTGRADKFVDGLMEVMTNDLKLQQKQCRAMFENNWTEEKITSHAMGYYFEKIKNTMNT